MPTHQIVFLFTEKNTYIYLYTVIVVLSAVNIYILLIYGTEVLLSKVSTVHVMFVLIKEFKTVGGNFINLILLVLINF